MIIVKDGENRDEKGEKTSRGFGFVEFKKHIHALTALHNLNNKRGTSDTTLPNQLSSILIVQ